MKIAIVSDIHLDINSKYVGKDLMPIFICCLKKQEADVIVIAGDLCDNAKDSIAALNRIEGELGKKVLFIPGNHDVWDKQGGQSAWDRYRQFEKHSSSLLNQPYEITDTHVIIGEMGWYDYSFAKKGVPLENILAHIQDWGDHKWSDWNMEDADLTTKMLHNVEKQVKRYQHKKIILVHHFVPYKDFLTNSTQYMDWDVYNAFMGSASVGKMIDSYENIEYVIFGHTHDRYGIIENYHNKTIICNPLGYIAERSEVLFEEEVMNSITVIELPKQ